MPCQEHSSADSNLTSYWQVSPARYPARPCNVNLVDLLPSPCKIPCQVNIVDLLPSPCKIPRQVNNVDLLPSPSQNFLLFC